MPSQIHRKMSVRTRSRLMAQFAWSFCMRRREGTNWRHQIRRRIGTIECCAHLFPMLAYRPNSLFQELFSGPDRFQLLETPFEQHRAEVG
jgi:hypothetical protein